MARDRIISQESRGPNEEQLIQSLRPTRLDECVGQRQVIEQLKIAMAAARQRGEPLEHILLDGPPGLGKTTLAHVVAHEMDTSIKITSGPALTKPGDLMPWLTNMERGDVLFIDEIHRLSHSIEEFLYPAMEDFRIDFAIESGMSGRTVNLPLKQFTLIGATTRAGLLTAAMRDRFGLQFHFDFYNVEDLMTMLRRSAGKLSVPAEDGALHALARRSRGTPRVANRLLRRTRDYAQVRADGHLTTEVVEQALGILQIDALGLDELDRSYLRALITTYGGGPAGVEALAATLGQERDTLEDVVEPYLLQIGFVTRTRQGRMATAPACEHLHLPTPPPRVVPPPDEPNLFDEPA
ncbi:MAG: Holliday junction branch migration DNA helicase RuvB [Phycisphaerae bacterium]|nr:Holliday junction branch migration DNA helicase RuvB [Phycisphaerae bacterium]